MNELLAGGFACSVEVLVDAEKNVELEVVSRPIWNDDYTEVEAGTFVYLDRLMRTGRARPLEGQSEERWRAEGRAPMCREWEVYLPRPRFHAVLRSPSGSFRSKSGSSQTSRTAPKRWADLLREVLVSVSAARWVLPWFQRVPAGGPGPGLMVWTALRIGLPSKSFSLALEPCGG